MKSNNQYLFYLTLLSFFLSFSANAQYLNPVVPVNPVNGLEYYYFETTQNTEPSGLDTMSNFLLSGPQTGFSLSKKLRNNDYTFNFKGYIKVPVDTVYTFYTTSDDGSNLYIDTTKVVANDGDHGSTEKSGIVRLKAGYHKLRVYYHQSGGGGSLSVSYASDLIPKAEIPDSVLFRNGIPFPEVTGLRDTTMFEEDSITVTCKVLLPGSNLALIQASGISTNPASIPFTNFKFSGTDSIRTIKIKSLAGVSGMVTVFIRFKSPGGNTGVKAFKINVLTRSPSLSQLPDTFLVINTGISNRLISVTDPDNAASTLTLAATSNNENVIANASIVVSGAGNNRFLSLNPVINAIGTATISYLVTDPSGRNKQASFVVIVGDTSTFRSPDQATNPVQGIDYLMARADGGSVLNFNSVLPDKAGILSNFVFTPAASNLDYFGMEYTGFVRVPKTAAYNFYTNSDDGSRLFIGTTEVVENDGGHGTQERSGVINLKVGLHKITVKYKEGNGGETLEVRYAGGGITKRLIPNSELFRNDFAYPEITAGTDTVAAYKTWFKTVPFTFADSDGDVSLATNKVFSYKDTIVPTVAMAVGGTGANRSLDFTPSGFGLVKLKVVMTDAQGLPAIQLFNVRVKDTVIYASVRSDIESSETELFPNPVSNRFEIRSLPFGSMIHIFDSRGMKKYSGPVGDADLSGFQKGIYLVKSSATRKVFKIVKN